MSEFEGKFIINRVVGRGERKRMSTREVSPEQLAPRYLKDERVMGMLEVMRRFPSARAAILENSRRILRVIPLDVSLAFKACSEP